MFCYTPKVTLGDYVPKQTSLEDKFGGLPWGLPPERWPLCGECGEPLTFLAQFSSHPQRFSLGKEGRVLFLFSCQDDCSTFDREAGANAVVIVDRDDLVAGLTAAPPSFDESLMLAEARVVEWVQYEEPLPDEEKWKCYDRKAWAENEQALNRQIVHRTKLGGFPSWIHRVHSHPQGYFFAGQYLTGPDDFVQSEEIVNATDENNILRYLLRGIENGIGYLFINPDAVEPKGELIVDYY
ncbi:DUF1963 domain-containing protein [Desmospora activa]|uniref:DUF1963 domain-containing protein n=1 Tax=Desmospora activa DSM 45169 TaxID=1121389 RepID=A0A2T4Z0G7_9BACL|nr:DUF1963 domain-containing protein [Desmospora activa]PTM53238.1 hypothetical protein C8J48_3549 [Desmospora activa DSM 45169]